MQRINKKIISTVLIVAMALSMVSSIDYKVASAMGEIVAGTEISTDETGFTAMIGFQTSDYDHRDTYADQNYSTGQKYLEWLTEQEPEVDLSNVQTCNGRNIYYNGNCASANKKTLQLRQPEKVELNKDAVVMDAKMTADGEYTVAINNLNLNVNPDGSEEASDEIFNLLYVAADIPVDNVMGVEVKASSVKIDGEVVASDVVLPQKYENKKYGQFMVANAYNPDKYADGVAFGKDANALRRIPEKSIEITFTISGVNWDAPKYQPEEIDFSVPVATEEPSKPTSTPVPADSGKYRSNINYADLDWEVQYWGESADETDVIATNTEVTGPGQYTVGLDFSQTKAGVGNGINFMDVEVKDLAEYYHPNRCIRLDEVKINGEKVPDRILRRAYTCSDNGIDTRVNLYNQWLPEDDAYAVDEYGKRNRSEARAIGRLEDAYPYLLEDYIDEEISTIEVTFTYGTIEEINKIDQEPTSSPLLPTQSPTDCPEPSEIPDRTPDVHHTPKPKDTPFPDETVEPECTPEPEETELPDPSEKPDQNDNDDLTDDAPNRDLKVRGLDIATDNVVKKGFLSVPQVQLTWDTNRNCDGYEIWKKVGNQSFSKVDYVDDSDEVEWFDTNLKKGCKYTYKVFGYVEEDDGTILRAKDGNGVSVKIRQTVKSCTYTAKRTGKKLKITFKKAEGTKYQIQVKYGKAKKWKKASGSLKKKIVKKVSPKKLKVRICTCEKVNGKMKYSKWSKAKTVR